MAGSTGAARATALRRDAILEAIAFAAERLLLSNDWRDVADDVLARLGIAADVSRAYVIATEKDAQGHDRCRRLYEWCAPGIESQVENLVLQGTPWVEIGFARWIEIMAAGEPIASPVASLPAGERDELGRQGVRSIAAFPVFVAGAWWGLIGLDDCAQERDWRKAEMEALRATATVLGAAIGRRDAEEHVLEAESRYREFVEHIPAVTYTDVPGADGAVLGFLSHQIEGLLGYPREHFTDDPDFWFTIVHPDDRERVEFAAKNDDPFDKEYRMIAADGRVVWVRDSSRRIVDADGSFRYWQGFLIDVTERKLADERLRESEDRYRGLVDNAPDAVLVHCDGRFVYANPAAAELLGATTPAALLGAPILSIVHPDDHDVVRERLKTQAATGASVPALRERFVRLDGEEIVVEVAGMPISWQGRPGGQIVVRDVTERTRSEERLREAERRYRVLVEEMPIATYIETVRADTTTADGVEYMSPRVEALLGYPPERWMATFDLYLELIHPEDREATKAAVDEADATGEPLSVDYRMRAADGRWVWLHEEAVLIRDDEGEPQFWQGFLLDVTERKHAEERMLAAESRYRLLVERIPAIAHTETLDEDGVYHPESTIAYVSPQVEALLGYTPAEWAEAGFGTRVIHPDDLPEVIAERRRIQNLGSRSYSQDFRMVARDGRVRWFHDESVLIHDSAGRPLMWQGLMTDISDRKYAEELLRQAEERFRELVERSPAIVYQELPSELGTPGSSIVYVSPQIETILGYTPDEWSADEGAWTRAMHPDDLDRVLRDGEASSEGGLWRDEYRMVATDGRVVWFHDEASLIRDAAGRPMMWQGVMVDITERKEAEERLRTAEERFRALVEHIPAVVYVESFDANPEKFYVSPQVEQVFGYTLEEWRRTTDFWFDHVHPDDVEWLRAFDVESNRTRRPFQIQYRFLTKDDRWIWVYDEAVFLERPGEEGFWQGFMLDITDRVESEAQIREAEERNRILVEHIPAVVYTERPLADGTEELYISPQVEEITGYTPEQWESEEDFWIDRVHPDDRAGAAAANDHADATREPFSMDYRFRMKDGGYAWLHDEATFVQIPGHDGFWQGFLLDISERARAEDQLREAEERYRSLVEQSPALIYRQEIDEETGGSFTTYISPVNETLVGYSAEEALTDPAMWMRLLHPDDVERVLELDRRTNETGEEFSIEYRMIHRDGHVVWVQDEAKLIRPGDGPAFWQGFMLDITERKAAEAALQTSNERFALIFDSSLDALVTMAPDGTITGWNPQAEATFGWAPDEVVGRSLAETIVPPEHRPAHLEGLARFLETGEAQILGRRVELSALHRDGYEFPVELSISKVDTGSGIEFSGFVRDITERRKAQEELERALEVEREAARQLRALDEMKNTFLQAVSHDLRTPLAAILGLAVTLERGDDVQLAEADSRDLARRIADNARKLDRLVTNLLDMDRLARGIVTPKLQTADVGALVRRLLAESELIGGNRLHTDIQPVVVAIDAAKVERIVENLLANTARHTPANAQIWVAVRPKDEGALIVVEDDGPGVPPDLRESIFEPFQQGPDAPQHSPGVGVGLTLVKRFAELHGGRAWVDEREGGGASFQVFLPGASHPAPDG